MTIAKASLGPRASTIERHEVAPFIFGLAPGRVALLEGIEPNALHMTLEGYDGAASETSQTALFAGIALQASAEALVEAALESLAEAARRIWPQWYASENFGDIHDSTLERAALRIRLDRLRTRMPALSTAWAAAAIGNALAGRAVRVAGASAAVEAVQLGLVLGCPVLVTKWEGAAGVSGDPYVAAIEWLARTMAAPILVLCDELPSPVPPWDRWARYRFAAAAADRAPAAPDEVAAKTWMSPVRGRPHPFSEAEKKLEQLLTADAELGALFCFNQTVRSRQGRCHRVDLLWDAGRLVVEIDGYADHSARPKFRDDRHRDYELLVAGYRVLRLTNDEIEDDCGRALEKIRDVVGAGK